MRISSTDLSLDTSSAIQICFTDPSSRVLVADAPGTLFAEAYGELVSMDEHVKILQFKKHSRFRALFLESQELQACRDALSAVQVGSPTQATLLFPRV